MNFSYRARLSLIALLLVLSTLFASCNVPGEFAPSATETQGTTTEGTTPEVTTPDASSPDETTLEESTPEEVETPEETSAEITTPVETEESTPEETSASTPEESTESSPEETTESAPEETTESSPEESTESSPEETAESSPEETTESSPEETTTPEKVVMSWDEFVAAEEDAPVVIQGVIYGIVETTKEKNDLYLQDENGGYFVYKLSINPAEQVLKIGMTVRVSGIRDTYYGVYQIANASVEILDETIKEVTPIDITKAFVDAKDLKAEDLTKYQSMLVTIKGATVLGQDTSNQTYFNFSLGGKQTYVRISTSTSMLSGDAQTILKQNVANHIGYSADITGFLSIYNGNIYIIPQNENAFSNFVAPGSTPEETTPSTPEVTTPEETSPAEPEVQDPAADSTLTIEQAIALGSSKEHNTYTEGKYYVTGVITEVYNTTYGNMKITDEAGNILTVYGTWSADGETRYDKMSVKPVVGDTVTVYGIVGQYNGTAQMKNGWIVEHIDETPEVTTPEVTTPNKPEETTPEAGTVKVVIADYAKNNNWTNSTTYPSIPLNSYITASAQGNAVGSYNLNTGKYYTNGQNWRLYQTEKATLTISGEGKIIVSVKVSYASEKTGVLTFNGKNIASDTVVAVNANSITFGVGNTDATVTNGQVRVTAIEVVYGDSAEIPEETTPEETTSTTPEETTPPTEHYPGIPAFSGQKYVEVNGNVPYFTQSDYTTTSYEKYSVLDALGRCGVAMACLGRDLMPAGTREELDTKPSGWVQASYDIVDGKYLYNRSHLIGWQLAGENDNELNLITGTRFCNQTCMLRYENMVADYIKETNNHVLYRVTPLFVGDELVARGVLMEAWSVEDNGDGICFNVFIYNAQPGIVIDYATGKSRLENDNSEKPGDVIPCDYIANKNSKVFHYPNCSSVGNMSEKNKEYHTATHDEMVEKGYTPCGNCNP